MLYLFFRTIISTIITIFYIEIIELIKPVSFFYGYFIPCLPFFITDVVLLWLAFEFNLPLSPDRLPVFSDNI